MLTKEKVNQIFKEVFNKCNKLHRIYIDESEHLFQVYVIYGQFTKYQVELTISKKFNEIHSVNGYITLYTINQINEKLNKEGK